MERELQGLRMGIPCVVPRVPCNPFVLARALYFRGGTPPSLAGVCDTTRPSVGATIVSVRVSMCVTFVMTGGLSSPVDLAVVLVVVVPLRSRVWLGTRALRERFSAHGMRALRKRVYGEVTMQLRKRRQSVA